MYDVAITGIGVVSCIGIGIKKVEESLKKGLHSHERELLGFRGCLTGYIKDFKPPEVERKKRKTMTEFCLQAYAAALDAIEMAGWSEEEIKSYKTGLIIGNDSTAIANIESYEITCENKSTLPVGANRVFMALNSTVSMNLNTLLGNRGASWTISGACASGGHAVGQAADLISMGRQDRIICGGVQEISWESVCSFDATNAFSITHNNLGKALRPFDRERDGLVPSGGAAVITLERMDLAKKRGADILGKIAAYSFTSDGSKLAVPSGDGLKNCMLDCISRAKVNLEDIDYICAHATSTPVGDAVEAEAINGIFKDACPWVSSTKSMTGHEMWMSGASQIVYSTIMNRCGFIAPNMNFIEQESEAAKIKITPVTIDEKPELILSNSAGFGGTNSCLILDYRV
jgi:3-oxoacyl-[acyl-carrier-protein] synthase-1